MDSLRLKNKQLESENQQLKLEREILIEATAFFASRMRADPDGPGDGDAKVPE